MQVCYIDKSAMQPIARVRFVQSYTDDRAVQRNRVSGICSTRGIWLWTERRVLSLDRHVQRWSGPIDRRQYSIQRRRPIFTGTVRVDIEAFFKNNFLNIRIFLVSNLVGEWVCGKSDQIFATCLNPVKQLWIVILGWLILLVNIYRND